MKKLVLIIACMLFTGCVETEQDREINDIIYAQEIVKSNLNYPDTAQFHMFKTKVTRTHVHLTVTAKNAFGVPSTHNFQVPRP